MSLGVTDGSARTTTPSPVGLAVLLGRVSGQWRGQPILRDFPVGRCRLGEAGLEQS